MRVGDLGERKFAQLLATEGASLRWGPFQSRILCKLPELCGPLYLLYRDFPLVTGEINDFHVRLGRAAGAVAALTSHAEFRLDDVSPFPPFPRRIALTMLEWGLNWCVYSSAHQFLMLHAAVIAKNDRALLLSGRPGAGKSTLCAALVASGWRLLSDELALVDPADGRLHSLARPISLKEESIELIAKFAPDAVFGPAIEDTHKGTVSHMRPPAESVRRVGKTARPQWIVLPRFQPGSLPHVEPVSKAKAFFELADNSFNYEILGELAFDTLSGLIAECDCHRLVYSELEDGIAEVARLTAANGD